MALATGSAMGLWEVKNCTSFRARYICRQSLGTPVTPELPGPDPTPSLTGPCPRGWGSAPKLRFCYRVRQPVGLTVRDPRGWHPDCRWGWFLGEGSPGAPRQVRGGCSASSWGIGGKPLELQMLGVSLAGLCVSFYLLV